MVEKIKDFLARSAHAVPVLTAFLVFSGFIGAGAFYLYKNNSKLVNNAVNSVTQQSQSDDDSSESASVNSEDVEAIKQNPPKTSASDLGTKSVDTKAGKATVVSTGGNNTSDSKIQDYADDGPTSTFAYIDNTGQYPNLGNVIKNYLNNSLLHGNEISYLYEVGVEDCSECDYGGYWTGSYIISGSNITKAYGYITLNVGPYKDSGHLEDYMKLVFSHEYGHHYTMYHRWVDLDIPSGQRFPSTYYTTRPLSYSNTATDYSLGWVNCDAEIIAEDYSYFYSGYSYSAVAGTHGYPSNPATKQYLVDLSGATPPAETTPVVEPEPEPEPEVDTTPPTVSINSPINGATVVSTVQISASASDNIGVDRVEFSINSSTISTDNSSPYEVAWNSASVSDGIYTLKAKAYDSTGNNASKTITIIVGNAAQNDVTKPVVTITSPAQNPYNWLANDLQITASATDNVSVVRIEIYINDYLAAEQQGSSINGTWRYAPTPSGSYTLKAKAYDAAGNHDETSIIIIKS